MSITFHSDGSIAHLTNGTISYVIELLDHTYLLHRYFGLARYRGHHSQQAQLYHRVCRRHAKPVLRRPAL